MILSFSTIFDVSLITLTLMTTFLIYKAYRRNIINKEMDNKLNIKTTGLREFKGQKLYNRTQSTPYLALESLIENYVINEGNQIVDYGAGKGRVTFFLNNKYNVPVTGIEVNETTFKEAKENLKKYEESSDKNIGEVDFKFEYAEEYKLDKNDTVFFFFNPFKPEIFSKVIDNIIAHSIEQNKEIDIILYYRVKGFEKYLKKNSFKLVKTINTKGLVSVREKIKIYKFKP